ncbi:MAG: FAD-binding oxidoreductase [Nitrospinae bacterium]|nr:FAD-binding oxidoreductase [Nitrospinota bacterium]
MSVAPESVEQVAGVLALAHREGLAVVPWGGGTTMGLGRPPERLDIVLQLHRLSSVLEHEPADLTATVQAGMTMADLQHQLSRRGQWWPVDPPWPESATLGGVLATNSSGPKRLLYGTARDLVIGMKVVHADGTLSKAGGKVTKNVTGYDMMKLYINSLGTLAVMVEATLKLRPLPAVQHVAWATFAGADAAGCAARKLLASELLPNAVELVNPPVSAFLRQAIRGPDAEGWSLLVGVDGVEQAVARQIRQLAGICHEAGATAWWVGADDGRLWTALQTRFRPQGTDRASWIVIRVGTVLTRVMGVLEELERIAKPLEVESELAARAGNGLIYCRIPLHGDPTRQSRLATALGDLRGVHAQHRSYLVIESAPPSFKAQFDIWGDIGPQLEIMRGLKREFDPRGVLNPGRFVGGL